jgi:hypothetical protein
MRRRPRHPGHGYIQRQGMNQEGAVGTIIQARQQSNDAHHPRWDRIERAERFRLSAQREQVAQSIRAIGHAYHFVDLERGVRRNGKLIAADIRAQIDQVRLVAARRAPSDVLGSDRESRARGAQNAGHDRVRLGVCPAPGPPTGLDAAGVLRHARPAYSLFLSRPRGPRRGR